MEFDVIVIGAGPAGSAAALTAAKGGAKVLLLEKGPEPGSKNVSGAMIRTEEIAKVFDTSSMPFERKVKNVDLIFMDSTGKVRISVDISSGLINVGRLKLDKWMAQQAEKAGAVLVTKTTALGVEKDGEKYKVVTDRGSISGSKVVLAEGVNALISMGMKIRPDLEPEHSVQAVKEVYNLNKDEINKRLGFKSDEEGSSWRIFGTNPVPYAGFLYTYKDAIAIGVGIPMSILIKKKISPYTVLDELKERLGINELVKGGSLREYSGKIYLAGDSIGLINALTFNGIGPAVISGSIAGKAALEGYECFKYEEELMKDKEIKGVVKARPLIQELTKEENLNYYVNFLGDALHSWAYGSLSLNLDMPRLIKHLMLGMGVLKA